MVEVTVSPTPETAGYGYYVEFARGWWQRCVGPNKDAKESGQTSAHYHGSVTEEQAKELERIVGDYLGRRYHPIDGAQVETMPGGKLVQITVDGSTHVRTAREWHALAVASFALSETEGRSESVTTFIKNGDDFPVRLEVDGEPTILEPGRSLEITHSWEATK